MPSPEDLQLQRLDQLRKESVDARAKFNLAKANLKLGQAKLHLTLKAKAQSSGEKLTANDIDALVEVATYSPDGELFNLWIALTESEAKKDSTWVVRKAEEHAYFHR